MSFYVDFKTKDNDGDYFDGMDSILFLGANLKDL